MVELHITFDEATGNVNVNGPINNKGLCYLMLECARDAVKDSVDNANRIASVAPANGITGFIRGRGKRR